MKDLLPHEALWGALADRSSSRCRLWRRWQCLGATLRVGLEDNLYLRRGVFATNGELVERARAILDGLGYELATPKDARQILGLPA